MASVASTAPAAEPTAPRTHTLEWADVWRLRGMLSIGILEACVMSVLAHIYLPYARSIQRCDVRPDAATLLDVHASSWSGSRECADRDYVTREAQSLVNLGQGITLGLCCVVLPTYGVLADRIGRWRVIAIYFAGISMLCVANALFPSNAVFLVSRSLSGALGDPHPIAHAQIADVCAPDVRSSCFALILVVKMLVGSTAGLLANYAIVGRHVYDYTLVWLGLALGAAALFAGCFAFPETHPRLASLAAKGAREADEPAEPAPAAHAGLGLAEALRVVSQPVLRHVIIVSCLCVSGLSAWSVVGGWLIIVYGWPQERFGYVSLALLPAMVVALALGPRLQRLMGVGRYLAIATAMMLGSLLCLDLAFMHSAFFYAALLLVSFAFSSAPAFMAATTLIVSEEDQGKTQGAVSATFHGVSAGALSLYGALFKAQALLPGRVVSLCFWVGSAFVALGVAYGSATRTWHDLSEAGKSASASGELRALSNRTALLEGAPASSMSLIDEVSLRVRALSRAEAGHVELS
ncbi:hypothetical protein KFE25_004058 [Diacronema lutheri]|uniref:Major facilitator superfamily (MFS) profile domain-containing protein n=1 Tax=Diacronema lutheri TaxID=2081491 RepID=A0A8J5XIC9_DIALT|nr:hypothetical protein KFE25_004058 [Diacronema lutheri]